MPFYVEANYEGFFAEIAGRRGGLGLSQKGKRVLLTLANAKTVGYWHDRFIKHHFEPHADTFYRYQERKKPYRAIKVRLAKGQRVFVDGEQLPDEQIKKGGKVSIVRSGRTERMAVVTGAVRATPLTGTAYVRVPSYVTSRYTDRPKQADEIKQLRSDEMAILQRVWRKTFLAGMRVLGNELYLKRRLGTRSGRI